MIIKNSEINDIDFIFEMYKVATEYQKKRVIDIWPEFDREMVALVKAAFKSSAKPMALHEMARGILAIKKWREVWV